MREMYPGDEIEFMLDAENNYDFDVVTVGADGYVDAPCKPGIGLDVNWQAMDTASINTIVIE